MGRDKALLELAGRPLIEHAVLKLGRVCSDVRISGGNPLLKAYAPLITDVHPGSGPVGGMEAALLGAKCEWNLFLPVDVPFLPTGYLHGWLHFMADADATDIAERRGARVMMWTVDQVPQPTVAVVHRDVGPFLTEAIERGEYKLRPVLEWAGKQVALRSGCEPDKGFLMMPYWSEINVRLRRGPAESWRSLTEAQRRFHEHWFDNLNTPEEFAEAERHVDALDT